MEFGEGKRHSLYLFLRAKKPFLKEDCGQNWVRVQLLNHSLTKKRRLTKVGLYHSEFILKKGKTSIFPELSNSNVIYIL